MMAGGNTKSSPVPRGIAGRPSERNFVMNEKLMSSYTAYTTAEEYGLASLADAPATTPVTIITIPLTFAGAGTYYAGC